MPIMGSCETLAKEDLRKLSALAEKIVHEGEKRYLALTPDELEEYKSFALPHAFNFIKAMVTYKKTQLAKNGIEWDCRVSVLEELPNELNRILAQTQAIGSVKRVHFIIKTLNHYNNIDVQSTATTDGNTLSIAVLDAVDDQTIYKLILKPELLKLKHYPFVSNVFYTSERIQNDLASCLVFAFKIASTLRNISGLHDHMQKKSTSEGEVKWQSLPLELLKLAQSRTFQLLDSKEQVINRKGDTLNSYFEKHQGFFKEQPTLPRNFASFDLFNKYVQNLLNDIEAHDQVVSYKCL